MQECFNQYDLTEQLACKPLRSVYLAHHISDASQEVVVKIFDSRCLNLEQESESLLQKVEWIKQFKYAYIVPVLDLGIEQGQPYVVSTYQSSGSLRDRLDYLAPQRLDLADALPIIFQVGRTLRYAHQHNILHGNLKPENIFFNEHGKALLADFHIADFIDVTKLDYKANPNATCYMAPEQFSGIISEKSDQYALACLTYELITGRMPASVQGFSSIWTKQHTQRTIPLSDLIPDLPEQAEEVVLKAMAKDPSERYATISIFLRALEALSFLPTSVFTNSPMMALRSDTPVRRMAEPLEAVTTVEPPAMRLSEASATTRLLERSKHVNKEHNTSRTSRRPSSKTLDTPSSKTLDIPSSKILDTPSSKTLDIPSSKTSTTLAEEADLESLTKGGLPQPRKPFTPTLWVAFALSGIVILMGVIIPYALVPYSPGSRSSHPVKNTSLTHPATRVTPTLAPVQSHRDRIFPSSTLPPTIQPHLTCSYAKQTSNVYNLTNEGTLDWIQWGLNAPEDVNHKLAVQQQISGFTLIGNGRVQRDNHYPNSYIWSDGTPVMVAPPQQQSGVYVEGISNGFTFTVRASTTPRTLRVYVGAYHVQGDFWAGINGRSFTDTTLDTRNTPKSEDNGIYTLTFSSSVPDQILTVKYTIKASYTSNSYVILEAATLQD